jgi:hypothetical protein
MVSISDELKERNILKLILIVRFACATFDLGHAIDRGEFHLMAVWTPQMPMVGGRSTSPNT